METSTALLGRCEGNPPIAGDFPSQIPITLRFDVFFELRLNKRLSKQSKLRWFQTPSRSLWRQCNAHEGMISTAYDISVWNVDFQCKTNISWKHFSTKRGNFVGLFHRSRFALLLHPGKPHQRAKSPISFQLMHRKCRTTVSICLCWWLSP